MYSLFLVLQVYKNSLQARFGPRVVCQLVSVFALFIQPDFTILQAQIKLPLAFDSSSDHPNLL